MNIRDMFASNDDEHMKFTKIDNPPSKRPDLCAFMLIDRLVPGTFDIVTAAEHDNIYLGVELDELERVATEDDVVTLIRCGVRIDSETDSLAMFT